jgi:hypothetical protein
VMTLCAGPLRTVTTCKPSGQSCVDWSRDERLDLFLGMQFRMRPTG